MVICGMRNSVSRIKSASRSVDSRSGKMVGINRCSIGSRPSAENKSRSPCQVISTVINGTSVNLQLFEQIIKELRDLALAQCWQIFLAVNLEESARHREVGLPPWSPRGCGCQRHAEEIVPVPAIRMYRRPRHISGVRCTCCMQMWMLLIFSDTERHPAFRHRTS